jgi:predicted dehydrogenase
MVGLNRRFAPMVEKLKEAFDKTTRADDVSRQQWAIPTSTWLHEADEGGGMPSARCVTLWT